MAAEEEQRMKKPRVSIVLDNEKRDRWLELKSALNVTHEVLFEILMNSYDKHERQNTTPVLHTIGNDDLACSGLGEMQRKQSSVSQDVSEGNVKFICGEGANDGRVTIQTIIAVDTTVECSLNVVNGTIEGTYLHTNSSEGCTYQIKTFLKDKNNTHSQYIRVDSLKNQPMRSGVGKEMDRQCIIGIQNDSTMQRVRDNVQSLYQLDEVSTIPQEENADVCTIVCEDEAESEATRFTIIREPQNNLKEAIDITSDYEIASDFEAIEFEENVPDQVTAYSKEHHTRARKYPRERMKEATFSNSDSEESNLSGSEVQPEKRIKRELIESVYDTPEGLHFPRRFSEKAKRDGKCKEASSESVNTKRKTRTYYEEIEEITRVFRGGNLPVDKLTNNKTDLQPMKPVESESDSEEIMRCRTGKLAKPAQSLWTEQKSYGYCIQASRLLRTYAYSSSLQSTSLGCNICGCKGASSQILTHIFCMHIKSTQYIDEEISKALINASRLSVLPSFELPVFRETQILCLLCNEICESTGFLNHCNIKHSSLNKPISYKENIGVDASILCALKQNILEFDHNANQFICNICSGHAVEPITTVQNAALHIAAHEELESVCEICQEHVDDLTKHVSEAHSEAAMVCDFCNYCTTNPIILEGHMRVNHPFELQCTTKNCAMKFYSEGSLRRHIINEHVQDLNEQNINYRQTIPSKGNDAFGADVKVRAKTVKVNFPCHLCGCLISGTASNVTFRMGAHMEIKHQDYLLEYPEAFRFLCKTCGKLWIHHENYRSHKVFCIGPRKCYFEGCNSIISSVPSLRKHFKDYHKEEFKCSVCDAVFETGRELENHRLNSHAYAGRNFLCNICGQSFKRPYALKVHSYIHTGEKPLKCQYCDFRGRQTNNITSHMKVYHKDKLGM